MKGNNTLTINEATMIEALQLLIDRDMPGGGRVTSVKASQQGSFNTLFTAELAAADEQK